MYYRDKNDNFCFSKDEIEAILPMLKQQTNKMELDKLSKNHFEYLIDYLEDGYKKAIRKEEENVYNGHEPVTDKGSLSLKSYMGANKAANFNYCSREDMIFSNMMFDNENYCSGYCDFKNYDGKPLDIKISYEDAKKLAHDTVKALDGEDTSFHLVETCVGSNVDGCRSLQEGKPLYAYQFKFCRNYNNVNLKSIRGISTANNLNIRKMIQPESIFILVDYRGIVSCNWRCPSELVDTITNDVPLLSFDKIEDAFKNHIRYKFAWAPTGDTIPDNIKSIVDINKVELNLMITAEKDNLETYLVVPVWDFIGDITYPQKVVCTNGEELKPKYEVSVLTINAIDGTVIDRALGY